MPRESIWWEKSTARMGAASEVCGAVFVERHRHVAGAATEVEGDGFGVLEDWAEECGRCESTR